MRRILWILAFAAISAQAHSPVDEMLEAFEHGDDAEHGTYAYPQGCKKATKKQKQQVNAGLAKKAKFLEACAKATGGSEWCAQLTRPNPENVATFKCTYGSSQAHTLIHPDESTWGNAFEAARVVEELEASGIQVCLIYNWWRPEPYNKNVGGAAGRHPFGTSVDVRFCSTADKERAHAALCELRRIGRINAVGYYFTKALHIGVGDKIENTWGKACH